MLSVEAGFVLLTPIAEKYVIITYRVGSGQLLYILLLPFMF